MTFCCTTVDKANNLMTKVERIISSSMLIMLIKTKFGNTPSPRCHLVRWYCKRWLWVGKATLPWAEALVQWLRVRIQAPHGWIAFHIFVVVKNGLMFQKTENKLKEAKDGPFKKNFTYLWKPIVVRKPKYKTWRLLRAKAQFTKPNNSIIKEHWTWFHLRQKRGGIQTAANCLPRAWRPQTVC